MNIQKLIKGIWESVKNIWTGLTGEAKKVMPVIIQLIENIKTYQDDGTIDALTKVIPGEADNWLAAKIREVLPTLLKDLNLANNCLGLTNENDIFKCAIKNLQLSSNDASDILLHGISSKLLELTSDGKLQWKNVIGLAEMIYQLFFKKKALPGVPALSIAAKNL